jgi:hypothetical protein
MESHYQPLYHFIARSKSITVIVENSINPSCGASLIIPFVVRPLPMINLNLDDGG